MNQARQVEFGTKRRMHRKRSAEGIRKVKVFVSDGVKTHLAKESFAAGMTLSDYIRVKLGLHRATAQYMRLHDGDRHDG